MMAFWILIGLVAVCWAESDPYELCIENEDCKDPDNQCCVYHPKFGTEFGICTPMSGLGAMCQKAHKHSRSYDFFCPCDDKLFECKTVGTWSTATNTKYDVDFCYTKNETKLMDEDKPDWHHPKPDDDDDSDRRKDHHPKDDDDDSDRRKDHHHKDDDDDSHRRKDHHHHKDDEDDSDRRKHHHHKDDDDDSDKKHHHHDEDDSESKHHQKIDDADDSDREQNKKHDDDENKDSRDHEVLPPAAEDPNIFDPEPED